MLFVYQLILPGDKSNLLNRIPETYSKHREDNCDKQYIGEIGNELCVRSKGYRFAIRAKSTPSLFTQPAEYIKENVNLPEPTLWIQCNQVA